VGRVGRPPLITVYLTWRACFVAGKGIE